MALRASPLLDLPQDIIRHFLMFHLVGMAGLLDEDQPVILCRGHVVVQVAEKFGRISVRGIVIGPHKQGAGVKSLLLILTVMCRSGAALRIPSMISSRIRLRRSTDPPRASFL